MQRRSMFIVVTVAVMAFTCTAEAKDKPLKVVICAGQSNMVGSSSKESELPATLKGEQENLFFKKNSWVPLAPGITEKKGFGPEISFAKELSAQLKEPVGIIKHSVGGTNLAKQWSPKDPKSLYAALRAKVEAAQKTRDIEIIGMIWMQGESDAKGKSMSDSYGENLAAFIQAARNDFKSPEMIFICGRINSPKTKFAYTDTVRKAQESCTAARYGYIDCDSLGKGADNLHYNTQGYVEMGRGFAASMLRLLGTK